MALKSLENAIREHARERQTSSKSALIPMDIYDCLEETLPHGLVIELGNLIMKLKGVGKGMD